MAQIMKYHEYPNNYNWDLMPDESGSNETAILMRDIGVAVGMNYACDKSGAKSGDAATAFNDHFGYQPTVYSSFDKNIVKAQLKLNLPVYLAGNRTKKCFLNWCSYKDGHAWVCDEYRSTTYCETGTTFLYLHMNWGWDKRKNDWYAYNSWNPYTDRNYKYEKRMIYNIKH